MKKILVTRRVSKPFQRHRDRYQHESASKGFQHRCECGMLLGAREDNVWHIHKNDLRVRITLPCLQLEIDCPACGKTNLIEEYQQPENTEASVAEFLM
jgi:hypothetical protein